MREAREGRRGEWQSEETTRDQVAIMENLQTNDWDSLSRDFLSNLNRIISVELSDTDGVELIWAFIFTLQLQSSPILKPF